MSEISELTLDNLPKVLSLEPQIFTNAWSVELISSEFVHPHALKVGIFEKSNLVGYSFSRIVEDELNLLRIGVLGDFRGRGIGLKLLESTLEEGRKKGCKIVFLEVREGSLIARSLYQKLGFVCTGRRPHYYSDNSEAAVLMELSFF